MDQRLEEVLGGREGNYMLPFFWQHGEEREKLVEMMGAIDAAGIKAVCVESRPHPDFVGPDWWRDMDIILEEAHRRDMRVWVLDDAHFPSGYCNGQVEENSAYAKRYLDHYTVDAAGPQTATSFFLALEAGEELLGVAAARRKGRMAGELEDLVDLTDKVRGKTLYWDVPEGYWNIIVIKSTFAGTGRKKYINAIDRDSVKFFLDTVYEPHFAHYGADFGGTFAGFFSDEPEMGNCIGEYGHNARIGQPDMRLPWCGELERLTREIWQDTFVVHLASLWNQTGDLTRRSRYEYMNLVTDLYGKNFCGQIGDWCRDHGVEYIGHVIEDNGSHARLGLGTGHFFKALWGQDMSGIDVVLQQIRPGYDGMHFYNIGGRGTYDGLFFHHGLAKMGTSLGHLDPKKKGRTMCEIFGAYGWSEGLKLMKWLADHMLVRGVNWFVPHAFTGAPFPDRDCPPHFYAWGKNPQYPWFSYLCHYMNRMSHLFNGGRHIASVALLYTAEMEWLGEYRPFEETGRLLAENQLDYEVIPMGLLGGCEVADGRLKAGGETFDILVIPESSYIPGEMARWVAHAVDRGLSVVFAGGCPKVTESGLEQTFFDHPYGDGRRENGCVWQDPGSWDWKNIQGDSLCFAGGEDEKLLEYLENVLERDVRCLTAAKGLRYYHYRQPGGDYYMFFNEDPCAGVQTGISLRGRDGRSACWYDGFDNLLEPVSEMENGEIWLELVPGEAKVLYLEGVKTCKIQEAGQGGIQKQGRSLSLDGTWRMSFKSYQDTDFSREKAGRLYNITACEETEDFSGTVRYEITFAWDPAIDGDHVDIDFGQVYETLELWLNGEKASVRIAPPYCCKLEHLRRGENRLTVYVTNTLVHAYRDIFSATMPVEGSGLLGPVTIQGYWE